MTTHNESVLVVDDNLPSLKLLRTILSKQGYHVRVATNGAMALESVKAEPPDIVLLDVMMPGLDGYDVCKRLKGDGATAEIPVLFISAVKEWEDKVKSFSVGGVDYITKPFREEEVLVRVRSHLTIRRITKRLEETNQNLERMVAERTATLTQTNAALEAEIARRIESEAALRESEEKLRSTLTSMDDMVFVLDKDGVFREYCQDADRKELYVTPEGFLGKSFREVMPPHVVGPLDVAISAVMDSNAVESIDYDLDMPEGTKWYSAKISQRKDATGEFAGVTAVIRDITERKHTEEQMRSLAFELSLVEERERRNIATELHDRAAQDLAVTILKLRSLKEMSSAVELQQKIDEIRALVETTTNKLRNLSHELSPPGLYEVSLEAALETLAGQFHQQWGISCSFNDDGSPKPLSEDERALLYRCVGELLANIAKHSSASSAAITIGRSTNRVEIAVTDDGDGFDTSQTGDGFGLFSIRERLHSVHGEMRIESGRGRGTRVMLTYPLQEYIHPEEED